MTGTVIKSAVAFALRRITAERRRADMILGPPCTVIILPVVRIDRGPDDDKPRRRRIPIKEGIWQACFFFTAGWSIAFLFMEFFGNA